MIRDPSTGRQWGTAADIARRLGVSRNRIYDWARRSENPTDPLHGKLTRRHLAGRGRGTTLFCLDEAQAVERVTRSTIGGPPRGQWAEDVASE